LDSADFFEFLTEVLDEWGGDDVDELMELLETQLAEAGVDLKYDSKASETEEDDADEPDDLDDDLDDEDDEDDDEDEDEEGGEEDDEV
jgi:hypothetical protein